jgi:hypothetical protein
MLGMGLGMGFLSGVIATWKELAHPYFQAPFSSMSSM